MWQKQLHLCIGHDCTISFNAHMKFLIRTFVFWLQTNNLQLNLKPIVGLFHYVPRSAAVIHACEYPQCSIYLDNILLIFGIRYSSCLWISSVHHSSLIFDIWGEVQFMLVNIKCAADICLSLNAIFGLFLKVDKMQHSSTTLTFGARCSSCLHADIQFSVFIVIS